MAEALKLLRQYLIEKKEYIEDDEKIIFGDIAYPKDAKTNFLSYETSVENKSKQYYTLGCIAYFIKNRNSLHSTYVRDTIAKKLPVVFRMDRLALLEYLDGKVETNASIDKNAPLEIQMLRPIKMSQEMGGMKRAFNSTTTNDNTHNTSSSNKKKKMDSEDLDQIMKQKIEQKLTGQSIINSTIKISENIKGLSENLSAEKIQLLKQKRLAKTQNTIISDENEDDLMDVDVEKHVKDTNALSDEISDLTKEILSRERSWRNRVTILESTGKTFDKNIFAILQSIKIKEENGQMDMGKMQLTNGMKQSQMSQPKSGSKSLGYNRFGQEQYASKDETGGFSIDTKSSFQYTTASLALAGTQQAPDVSSLASKSPSQSTQHAKSHSQSSKRSSNRPIIIVPSSRTSLITLFNALDILQELKYVSSEDKRKALQTQSNKDYEIITHRREDGKSLQFKVIEDANKLNKEDWDRVVCAFAQGPAWQFKNWPWDGNPSEIFSHIKGFHLKWNGMSSDLNISKMAVHVIELDQNRRHLDRARLLNFWEELDKEFEHLLKKGMKFPYFASGPVVKGFGRGSKELGIPTANFPHDVVEELPKEFKEGVYYGWAQVNDGPIYRMVLSVGNNPYYNNEKRTMETYVMHKFDEDFYGATLKVLITGWIREMRNYTSLEELIDAIHKDINDADRALDIELNKNALNTQKYFNTSSKI